MDRYGFKKSLSMCFAIFSVGYLLIGLAGMPAGRPLVHALGGPKTYMLVALVITAIGGSLIKPSIVGTVARTTTHDTKSLGYSVYYTLVNVGGFIGPNLGGQIRDRVGVESVFYCSAAVAGSSSARATGRRDHPDREPGILRVRRRWADQRARRHAHRRAHPGDPVGWTGIEGPSDRCDRAGAD